MSTAFVAALKSPRASAVAAVLGALLALAGCESKHEDHVAWTPIASADSAARSAGKPILYDFTAAWCPPCQAMKRDLFSHTQSAETINRLFIPVQVLDRSREDGRNPPEVEVLQRRYAVEAFPTLVIAAPGDGEPVLLEGYPGREPMLQALVDGSMKVQLAMRAAPR